MQEQPQTLATCLWRHAGSVQNAFAAIFAAAHLNRTKARFTVQLQSGTLARAK